MRRIEMKVATAFFAVLVPTVSSSSADPAPPPLPPNVQAAIRTTVTMFSNVLITGERSRRVLVPYESVLRDFHTLEREADFTQELHFELRFRGPQFRESIQYPSGNAYTTDVLCEVSFDNMSFRFGNRQLKNIASSRIDIFTPAIATAWGKLRDNAQHLSQMQFWYLMPIGFIGPNTVGKLGQPVQSAILIATSRKEIVAINGVGTIDGRMIEVIIEQPEPWQSRETFDIETHEPFLSLKYGSDKLQMRMERERRQLAGKHRVTRFMLNSAKGYAVEEQWESRKESGETMFHTKNSEFVQVGSDAVWVPKRCVIESYAYDTAPSFISSAPLYETVIQLGNIETDNVDEGQCRIWYDDPGVEVSDWTSPKATLQVADTYRVPVSIDKLPNTPGFGRMGWLIVLNVLFIVGWAVWFYSRPRKKSAEI